MNENEDIVSTERLLLRALCLPPVQGSVRDTARRLLRDYCWKEPLHQTLFHVLCTLSTDDPETIHNLLPSSLARYGYPDVDFASLFEPHSLSKEDVVRLMSKLRGIE